MAPKMRFPEFKDAAKWQEQPVGAHIEEYREKSTHQDEYEVLTSSRDGLVRQKDYYDNTRITERDNVGFNVIPPNYITYRSRSDDRKFFFNENELGITGIISTYYPVFRVSMGSNKFLTELLSRYSLKVGMHSVGTSQTVLSLNELKKIWLPFPEKKEQQKIADCLSSIDELIRSQAQKLEKLCLHKKGLLQGLFPQEGKFEPELRFSEFKDAAKWQEQPVGAHIEEYREKSTHQDEYEVLTSSRDGLVRQKDYYDNTRITERDNVGFNVIPPNYITYRSRSDDRKFFFNENELGITGIISTYYPVFRVSMGSNKFLTELLSRYSLKVGMHSVGTSQTVLSLNELKKIWLPFPEEKEQQKIADCLSSIDELIWSQKKKLEELYLHKAGLKQQLFPSMEEVGE